jgi:hypothetical protein
MSNARFRVLMASVGSRAQRAAGAEKGEIAILALWTLVVTRPYLNWDPNAIPVGRDFVVTPLSHHFWVHVRHCGMCALWNGVPQLHRLVGRCVGCCRRGRVA